MKINLFALLCFLSQLIVAQQITFKGKILDETTQEPVFGAAILLGENSLCFSGPDGEFIFEIDGKELMDTLKVVHMSFEPRKISLLQLKKESVILLSQKFNQLVPVILSGKKLTVQDLIKKASKKFRDISRITPYWSTINYKHIVYLEGAPHAYMEFDGHIFMVGEHKDPFLQPLLVPRQIRRTKESPEIIKSWWGDRAKEKDFFLEQTGGRFAQTHWVYYRCFEVAHPLGKEKNNFEFTLENEIQINGKTYYVVAYKQKNKISFLGRWIDYMHGELWISKNDFVLQKATTAYRFENISFYTYAVDYNVLKNNLYPKKMAFSAYMFEDSGSKKSNVVISGLAVFKQIDYIERTNYRKKIIMGPWIGISNKYDPVYWKDRLLSNGKYKNALLQIGKKGDWDSIFLQGAHTKEIKGKFFGRISHLYKKNGDQLIEIMKRDLNL